jgi:hypothetical protein
MGIGLERHPAIMGETESPSMRTIRFTIGISRTDLIRDCLQEVRLWPGCETVEGIAVLAGLRNRFTLHATGYGRSKKYIADRALRCIQREKQRHFHLKME